MKLYVGNKNYSSWSMRPWVLMREFDIAFDEVMLRFDGFGPNSTFKQAALRVSPTGLVPVLVLDDGTAIWDTLAIAETLAEQCPDKPLWPRDAASRARARSIACEMHSGFSALRGTFPQNIEASLPDVGVEQLAKNAQARADLARIDALWTDALARSGGPFLFGAYSIADAMYAPVAGRVRTYALPVGDAARGYVERLWATKGVAAWVRDALAEQQYLDFEEPYRKQR
jgi:glutathione S-transferase